MSELRLAGACTRDETNALLVKPDALTKQGFHRIIDIHAGWNPLFTGSGTGHASCLMR
ncbi:hypothetical protein [Ktedonobacter sp. SOSP1-85]|uniref:hypothetical protein n=1 Tax=Ktedonobacter sp. SOSP1-85 TaxID=2778367 RepID=UPI001915B431|nr:hypothetical protein [Ktedonobacter sp. SOSP1-85]